MANKKSKARNKLIEKASKDRDLKRLDKKAEPTINDVEYILEGMFKHGIVSRRWNAKKKSYEYQIIPQNKPGIQPGNKLGSGKKKKGYKKKRLTQEELDKLKFNTYGKDAEF